MNAQQLKNSILQEAIEGRLVPQDPNDEPASVLLDKIRKEKARLVKEGKLKKKDLEETPISEDEIPFHIPESWVWCRVGDIFIHASGKQQSSNNKQIGTLQKYITTSNLYWGYFVLDTLKEMYFSDEELVTCSAQRGDLLVCEGGAGYGRSAIWDKDYDICLQNHVHRLRPIIKGTCEYVYYLIYLLKESNRLASVGTAMPGLSANRLKELFVPLPPLTEQKRIVAKIEELLPKVEAYGKAQEKLNKLNEELPEKLKKSILQEAIEGCLVPQDSNDEPASVLLDKIRKEKARLVKEGKLKKKDLEETPISEDEIPFDIPKGWEWVRWGMLGDYKKGPFGSSLTKSMFVPKSNEAVKVYEQKNAIQKDYSLGEYYISKEKYETMTGFTVKPGDIIVSCAGTIGETYLLPHDAPEGIINQALMRARLHLDSIAPYWLLNFRYILLIENKLKGAGSAIKNIPPFEVLKAMPVPLPPLAEQERIVEKIEQLLHEIDKLKV